MPCRRAAPRWISRRFAIRRLWPDQASSGIAAAPWRGARRGGGAEGGSGLGSAWSGALAGPGRQPTSCCKPVVALPGAETRWTFDDSQRAAHGRIRRGGELASRRRPERLSSPRAARPVGPAVELRRANRRSSDERDFRRLRPDQAGLAELAPRCGGENAGAVGRHPRFKARRAGPLRPAGSPCRGDSRCRRGRSPTIRDASPAAGSGVPGGTAAAPRR
jgi:hypothetical protein